jgi:hypothetical protein
MEKKEWYICVPGGMSGMEKEEHSGAGRMSGIEEEVWQRDW